MNDTGPLTRKVLDYVATMQRLVPTAKTPADWAPLTAFVAVDDFERVGTFLEVQDWQQYTALLTQWSSATGRFETVVRRTSEVDQLVYYEVEERHQRSDGVHVINSMTVFAFDDDGKICHLDVYLQQAPPSAALPRSR
jgi:hypothetical protein